MRSGEELSVASMAYFRLMARVRERLSDRLRFGLHLATTPSTGEWSIVRLPGPMFPLYGVLRAGRVAKRLLRGK
jgi:hypothetical protein